MNFTDFEELYGANAGLPVVIDMMRGAYGQGEVIVYKSMELKSFGSAPLWTVHYDNNLVDCLNLETFAGAREVLSYVEQLENSLTDEEEEEEEAAEPASA